MRQSRALIPLGTRKSCRKGSQYRTVSSKVKAPLPATVVITGTGTSSTSPSPDASEGGGQLEEPGGGTSPQNHSTGLP